MAAVITTPVSPEGWNFKYLLTTKNNLCGHFGLQTQELDMSRIPFASSGLCTQSSTLYSVLHRVVSDMKQ